MENINWNYLTSHFEYFIDIGFTVKDAELESSQIISLVGKNARILVIGCATGRTLEPFFSSGLFTIGVDSSPEMLAKSAASQSSFLFAADARNLPFKSGFFDLVIIATGVLDSMDDANAIQVFSEAARVSNASGHIAAYTHRVYTSPVMYKLLFIQGYWLYHRRYMRICELIQKNAFLSYMTLMFSKIPLLQSFSTILQEPVLLRKYFASLGNPFSWNAAQPFFNKRFRLWSLLDISRLTACADLSIAISFPIISNTAVRTLLIKSHPT
jgi:SAM-dependent methyltransferase